MLFVMFLLCMSYNRSFEEYSCTSYTYLNRREMINSIMYPFFGEFYKLHIIASDDVPLKAKQSVPVSLYSGHSVFKAEQIISVAFSLGQSLLSGGILFESNAIRGVQVEY